MIRPLVCSCSGPIMRRIAGNVELSRSVHFRILLSVSFSLAALAGFGPSANAMTYSTTGFYEEGLGAQGSFITSAPPVYDIITAAAVPNGTLGPLITLNPITFNVGVNAVVPNPTNPYTLTEDMSINGGLATPISIPFNVDISYTDLLTFAGGSIGNVDGYSVTVLPLSIGRLAAGVSQTADLQAEIFSPNGQFASATPLPAALPLFAGGLGVIGLVAGRRKRKAQAAA
jgi:hypothetical protein